MVVSPRVIVITGCDSNHFWLAEGLIQSLRAITARAFHIGFAQVGDIAPAAAIRDGVDVYRTVSVDDAPHQPGQGFLLAALAVKSRLPELFPGYDVYIWLDGDTWVQNSMGLDELILNAHAANICINPQIEPDYFMCEFPDQYTIDVYTGLFGEARTKTYVRRAMVNSGVFSATAGSPLWARWTDLLMTLREQLRHRTDRFFSDQIPLHYLIFSGQITMYPLRSVNNWLVAHAMPGFHSVTGHLLVPSHPHEEINIVHLLGPAKNQTVTAHEREYGLTYQGMQAFRHALRDGAARTISGPEA